MACLERPIRGKRRFHLRDTSGSPEPGRSGEENFYLLKERHLGPSLQLGTSAACIWGRQLANMNNSRLLFSLVSLSLIVINARAASLDDCTPCLQLAPYQVEAPRQTAAERQIACSLQELRAAARAPLVIKAEIPLLKARIANGPEAAKTAPDAVGAKS